MAITYPSSLDSFTNPSGTSLVTSPDHAQQHSDANDAIEALEQKVGLGAGTPVANRLLWGTGNGTSGWSNSVGSITVNTGTINNSALGSPTMTSGTLNNVTLGSPQINNGTINNAIMGTPRITGGTLNNATIGTPITTGGTLISPVITTPIANGGTYSHYALGSLLYAPTTGGTTTIQAGSATRHLVQMPNNVGLVTLAVAGAVANQPFLVEIRQGTAGLGTIAWFSTVSWSGSATPSQTLIASRKDTFGFIATSTNTFDGYIVGQNL